MAISSSVWKPASLHARSPSFPHRPLPLSLSELKKSRTWYDDDKAKRWPQSPTRPKLSASRRTLSVVAQQLSLPRKWRRPTGPIFLAMVVVAIFALALAVGFLTTAVASVAKVAFHGPMLMRRHRPAASMAIASTSHVFHPNGHLLVNPRGRHPILTMIEKAEQEWTAKVGRQSKTLQEAAAEYRRRYKRHPPKGFDHWWAYVQANNVQLPDEYDQIDRDLRAYWALDPEDLARRNEQMQERPGTFTLAIASGFVSVHGDHAELRRATDLADIIARFSHYIRADTNMTFIIEDQPAVMMSHERRSRMHELSLLGEQIGPSDFLDEQTESDRLSNYALACSPQSTLRKAENGDVFAAYSEQRSFVWDHVKAMNICNHPEWRHLHGLASQKGTGIGPLVPLFTFAKMSTHDDILATPLEQYWDQYEGEDPVWSKKTQNKLLWRGTTTGAEFRTGYNWRQSQRARLHFMSHETQGLQEVLETVGDNEHFRLVNQTAQDLNARYMDTSFAGEPAQCDFETCEWMKEHIDFAPTQGLEESYQYKYMLDVDGNGWSGRFHRLMSTRSLVLKSTIFPEWYADRLQPWYHYVPIKVDYSDLYDVMIFFGAHDALAERLASNGKEWAATHWRRVDMASYMFRLTLEWSRLLNQDDDMNYTR